MDGLVLKKEEKKKKKVHNPQPFKHYYNDKTTINNKPNVTNIALEQDDIGCQILYTYRDF